MEIVEIIHGYESVIIIDAIKTIDGIPGNIYHFTPDDFRQSMHASNFHDLSFITAMKFGRESGLKLPLQINIIAIEIVEDMVFRNRFSPVIEKAYPEILNKVQKLILNIFSFEKVNIS